MIRCELLKGVRKLVAAGMMGDAVVKGMGVNKRTLEVWRHKEPGAKRVKADLLAGLTQKEIDVKYGMAARWTNNFLKLHPDIMKEVQGARRERDAAVWQRRLQPYFAGCKTQGEIARKYGVAAQTVSRKVKMLTDEK